MNAKDIEKEDDVSSHTKYFTSAFSQNRA